MLCSPKVGSPKVGSPKVGSPKVGSPKVGRLALVAVAVAVIIVPSQASSAHEGPTDPRGGHMCRPSGGGAADCTDEGVQVGEYHCMAEACTQYLQSIAESWCWYGIPVPIRSSMVGVFPVGEIQPPIRVERREGAGHVLEVTRDYVPTEEAPEVCNNPDPGLEVALTSGQLAEHAQANGSPAQTRTAAVGFESVSDDGAALPWSPTVRDVAIVWAAVAAAALLRRVSRRRAHWQSR